MSTYRRPATDEARERANAYRRRYRKEHPDRVQKWRRDYIRRAAARLTAAQDNGQKDDAKGGESE